MKWGWDEIFIETPSEALPSVAIEFNENLISHITRDDFYATPRTLIRNGDGHDRDTIDHMKIMITKR